MKYLILETPDGLEVPIVFGDVCQHIDMIPNGMKPISGGQCDLYTRTENNSTIVDVDCYGQSTSLGLKPRATKDAQVIRRELNR